MLGRGCKLKQAWLLEESVLSKHYRFLMLLLYFIELSQLKKPCDDKRERNRKNSNKFKYVKLDPFVDFINKRF